MKKILPSLVGEKTGPRLDLESLTVRSTGRFSCSLHCPGTMNQEREQDAENVVGSECIHYRCPCGSDVKLDPQNGGHCQACNRDFPASVMQLPMTLTFTDLRSGEFQRLAPAQEENDPLIGKSLGYFEIIESIGRGGMGQVYRALDKSLQRYVAVKVIHNRNDSVLDSQSRERLMHEAVAQARVNHPNIVTIFYVGQESDTTFLAMELVDGYDASRLIERGNVMYEEICSIAVKITSALKMAAEMGIVHSDIKPQNLLIQINGDVKLSDFGMARITEGENEQIQLLGGTPSYLAPELLANGKPTTQTDMYALGVTLFELSFGELPVKLSGSSLMHWAQIHAATEVKFPDPWPQHLPEDWQLILKKLLAKNPQDRFLSYAELESELSLMLPVKRTVAGALPRGIAWILDVTTIIVGVLIFVFASQYIRVSTEPLPLIILSVYSIGVYWFRQSLGRYLFHLQVVNRYGLKPNRKTMLAREMARMQFLWILAIAFFTVLVFPQTSSLVIAISLLASVIDMLYLMTVGRGSSMHDQLFGTQSVVVSEPH